MIENDSQFKFLNKEIKFVLVLKHEELLNNHRASFLSYFSLKVGIKTVKF